MFNFCSETNLEAMDDSEDTTPRRWWRRLRNIVRGPISLFRRASTCRRGSTESLTSSALTSAPVPVRGEYRRRAMEEQDSSESKQAVNKPKPRAAVAGTSTRRPKSFVHEADVHAAQSPKERSLSSQDTFKHIRSLLTWYASSSNSQSEQLHSELQATPPQVEPVAVAGPSSCHCDEIEINTIHGRKLIKISDLTEAINQAIMKKSASFTEGSTSSGLGKALFAIPVRLKPVADVTSDEEVSPVEGDSYEEIGLHELPISHESAGLEGEGLLGRASQEGIKTRKEKFPLEKPVPDEEAVPQGEVVLHKKGAPCGETPPSKAKAQQNEDDVSGEAVSHERRASYGDAPFQIEAVPLQEAIPQGEALPPQETAFQMRESSTHTEAALTRGKSSSNSDSTPYSPSRSSSSDADFQRQLIVGTEDMRRFLQFQETDSSLSEQKMRHDSAASIDSNVPSLEMDKASTSATSGGSANLYGEGPSGLCHTQRVGRPPLLRSVTVYDIPLQPTLKQTNWSTDSTDDDSTSSPLSSLTSPSNEGVASTQPTDGHPDSKSAVQTRKQLPNPMHEARSLSNGSSDSTNGLDAAPNVLRHEHSQIVQVDREPGELGHINKGYLNLLLLSMISSTT